MPAAPRRPRASRRPCGRAGGRRAYTARMRIVSLVPNGTEILFALGAG
ncbi:MAG: hypothetical protein JOZ15_03790, partial [Acidobacteria bacterium]|nr:hypothetical protein [Acidobacteriota bacterium]